MVCFISVFSRLFVVMVSSFTLAANGFGLAVGRALEIRQPTTEAW